MGVGHDGIFGWGYDAAAQTGRQGEHSQLKGYPALVGR